MRRRRKGLIMKKRRRLYSVIADDWNEIINKSIPEIRRISGDDVDISIERFPELNCFRLIVRK